MKSRSIGGVTAAGCADAAVDVVVDDEAVAEVAVGAGVDGATAAVGGTGATGGIGLEVLAGVLVGARGGATGTGSSCG
jgi:hypothetical protein